MNMQYKLRWCVSEPQMRSWTFFLEKNPDHDDDNGVFEEGDDDDYSDVVGDIPFIHSFILAISIAPLQVLYYSEALPTTARILYRSFTPKRTGNSR